MAGVRIVTDSACDLADDQIGDLPIDVIPLKIRFGDQEYVDRVELSSAQFYEKLRGYDGLPETAAPAPGDFAVAFDKARADGYDAVVCVNISSELSATMQAAQSAAKESETDVRVVDSRSITAGLGTQVLEAARAARDGADADDVVARLDDLIRRTHVFGTLDTLEYLKKGGRIGNAKALLGTMLSFKPCLDISTGVVEEAGRQRTRRKALRWMAELVSGREVEHLAAMHADASDIDDFLAALREVGAPEPETVGIIGPVIGTHGGPGTLGLCWVDPA